MVSTRLFVAIISAAIMFPVLVVVASASNGWRPPISYELRCRGFTEWTNENERRLETMEELVDKANTTSAFRTNWSNLADRFEEFAEEQEESDFPEALRWLNQDLVEIYEVFERAARANDDLDFNDFRRAERSYHGWIEELDSREQKIHEVCGLW